MGGQIGAGIPRREDARLVSGAGCFVADRREPGCLEAAFVRSGLAHGRLTGVRLDAARQVPGVVAAASAADLPEAGETPPLMDPEAARGRPWPALATDRVRYVGQPVAIVVAADRYAAEDGCDAAVVDLEPLPVLLDPTEAAGSPVELFPGRSNVVAEKEFGDVVDDTVWRDAAVVVEARYRQPLLAHTSLEARAILVRPEPEGGLTVWCSHQAPHRLRRALAGAFELPEDRVRVVVADVGGAFGGKSETYPEYLAVVAAARRLGRPVRWIEDRAEALAGPPHGRGQNQRVRLAADAAGRMLALALEIDADIGGYPHTGSFVPFACSMMASGAYAIPQVHVRTRAIVTTTAPTAPYRGAGRPEAAYAIERTVDLLARRLEIDPAELRRRNHIAPELFPYRTPTGFTYDSGNYPAALSAALRTVGYDRWRAEQARRRDGGGPPLGIGICTYVERTGVGPELGAVEVRADGGVVAYSGCCSAGQGHETTFPQVVADVLDIPPERVELVEGDTGLVPWGVGSFASRSMQTGGGALHRAALRLVDEGRRRIAGHCGVGVDEVGYDAGVLTAAGRSWSLAELVSATGELRVEESFEPPQAFPFGAHVAVVELDAELGTVTVLRLIAVDDCGVVVNPLVVTGQAYGSVMQGLGQSLYEQVRYDADGRPQALSLLDYLLPTVSELPPVTLGETRTPNPNTGLGAKGAGEAGCIGVPPAIVNAVADALDLDIPDVLQLPLTPRRLLACGAGGRPSGGERMKPAPFSYVAARSAAGAVEELAAGPDTRILAGGQSLVPEMNYRTARPARLVDINPVPEFAGLEVVSDGAASDASADGGRASDGSTDGDRADDDRADGDRAGGDRAGGGSADGDSAGAVLRVRPLVRHRAFERPPPGTGPLGRLLARASRHIAHPPVRARGTMLGSLAYAHPAAEWPAVAVALDARLRLTGVRTSRELGAAEFFTGPFTTARRETELLTEVRLPLLPAQTGVGFVEHRRTHASFAQLAVVAVLTVGDTVVTHARLALAGAADRPVRARAAEAALLGHPADPATFAEAGQVAARHDADPRPQPYGDVAYQRHAVAVLVRRALAAAAADLSAPVAGNGR